MVAGPVFIPATRLTTRTYSMDQINSTGAGTTSPASPAGTAHAYRGACTHCGHQTTASRPGIIACKWGRCNGTVHAL